MSANYSPDKIERSLKASIFDGMFHAAMIGLGESYLSAYAIYMSASPTQIGLLASLPILIGAISQAVGLWLTENTKSRLRLVTIYAFFQGVLWLPIALIPFVLDPSPIRIHVLILLTSTLFALAGIVTLPWNSVVGDMIP